MPRIDFFYFFGSAYPISRSCGSRSSRRPIDIRWRPFSVRDLMTEKGYSLRTQPTKWSGPLRVDEDHAVDLTVCRVC